MDLSSLFGYFALLTLVELVFYTLFRFLYFGPRSSYRNELQKIIRFEYFDKLKVPDYEKNNDKRVSGTLNALLTTFYVLLILLIILAISSVTQSELNSIA
jgi:hypothetical protein